MKPNDAGLDAYEKAAVAGGAFRMSWSADASFEIESCCTDMSNFPRSANSVLQFPKRSVSMSRWIRSSSNPQYLCHCESYANRLQIRQRLFKENCCSNSNGTVFLFRSLIEGPSFVATYLGWERPVRRDSWLRLEYPYRSNSQIVVRRMVPLE